MKNERGFTLIEFLMVIVITGVLVAITLPILLAERDRENYPVAEKILHHEELTIEEGDYYRRHKASVDEMIKKHREGGAIEH